MRNLRIIPTKYYLILCIISMLNYNAFSQEEDLLAELEEDIEKPKLLFQTPAFKAMKIANLQSTKIAANGDFYMYVSHRFGTLKDGISTFFGLDNANTKIQFVYGLTDYLQLGLSRESLRKTYAGSAKIKLLSQNQKTPVNITFYSTLNINTELSKKRYPKLKNIDRLSYTSQLLISKRLSNNLSLELAPSYIYQNLVLEPFQQHAQFALAVGGRFKLTKRMSINLDYAYNFSRHKSSAYKNPLTLGLDIETGGHVFQLLFSNAQSTNEPGFLTNAEGNWSKGDIFFGFNIVRVF